MYGGVEFCDYPNPDNVTKLDHGCLPMIADMHKYGIRLDVPHLNQMSREIGQTLEDIEYESSTILGSYQDISGKGVRKPFMITSPDHVSRLLFQWLKIQGDDLVPMTEKGARFATSDDILSLYKDRHPIIPLILEHRELSKLKGTYTDPLPLMVDSDSRLHTQFNATQAATGRLSSSNPNLQNIPIRTKIGKEIRRAFIAQYGCVLVSCDLSQIEMVWAAHRSQDPTMLEVFRKGQDLHSRTACIVFNLDYEHITRLTAKVEAKTATLEEEKEYKYFKSFQRLPCKTTGFGVLYGQTGEGLQSSLTAEGIPMTLELCQDFIDNKFFGAYPLLKVMLDRDYARAKAYGLIWDAFGRVRLVPQAKSSLKWLVNEGTRQAGNHPEQSSAQATIKLAMAELTPIYRQVMSGGIVCRPLLQIHDQLIFEVTKSFAQEWAGTVRHKMENATPISIPTRASSDVGNSWLEL
jgi:DNA polymerase-1